MKIKYLLQSTNLAQALEIGKFWKYACFVTVGNHLECPSLYNSELEWMNNYIVCCDQRLSDVLKKTNEIQPDGRRS